jgi:hypothetical protein
MVNAPRTGGIAALVAAATFVVGIVMFVTVMSDYATGDPSPSESVAFLVDNQLAFQIWNIIIYLCFGIALVPLTVAVHARLTADSPLITQIATAFGLIWAGLVIASGMIANVGVGTVVDLAEAEPSQADSVWSSLDAVQNGLGGGNEIVGGLWVLLVSWAAWKQGLPKGLNVLGLISGVAGVVTIAPALEEVGAVFGLGMIVWFVWIGVLLLREAHGETKPDLPLTRQPT